VHFSRSLPSNSWWQTMVGCQVLSRPSAAEGAQASLYRTCHPAILGHRGRRLATAQPGVSKPGRSTVNAWQHHRNKHHAKANWQFKTADARVKLKRLYPQFG